MNDISFRKKNESDTFNRHLGKLPPQAVDLEELVLGAILLEKNAILNVVDLLSVDVFYKDSHQHIYRACTELYHQNKPIDLLTVTHKLRDSQNLEVVGGAYYISKLTERIASAANIEYHARILMEKYAKREMIRISGKSIMSAYEDTSDVFESIDTLGLEVDKCQEFLLGNKMEFDISVQSEQLYKKLLSKDIVGAGIHSGYADLDKLTGGWQRGEMSVLMARPGMGKTSWLIESVIACCKAGKNCIIFSIEMSAESLLQRMFSNMSGVDHNKIKNRQMNNYELDSIGESKKKIAGFGLTINDSARVNTQMMKTVIRSQNRKMGKKTDIIFIDYLQMIKTPSGVRFSNRDSEVTEISKDLKAIAKEFDIPVVVVSSMNRECEKRLDKRPEMSDARDSGSIESDADVILSLYRPAVYWERPSDNKEQFYQQMQEADYKKITELSVLKQRSGGVGTILQNFEGQFFRFLPYRDYNFKKEAPPF